MKSVVKTAMVVVWLVGATWNPAQALGQCCGDCDGDGHVTVDEAVEVVNRALNGCQDDGICTQSGAWRFPATGQTTCWDSNGNVIPCSGTGQDGDVRAGAALAYVDNGDGTVTDKNTGLMWEKLSWDGSIHDWNNTYRWDDAFTVKVAALNAGGGFAGHTDWRLPNVKELQSIVNYENVNPAIRAAFNANCVPDCTVTTCSCTWSYYYWSATTPAGFPGGAWYVSFSDGYVDGYSKTTSFYVRAVRGGL